MNKETLRMQMLAGVITESQYKEKLQEGIFQNLLAKLKGNKKPEPVEKSELDGLTDEQAQTLYDEYMEMASSIDPRDPTHGGWSTSYEQTANKIKMKYPNIKGLPTKNESLNEHFVAGGIVGIGAINQIPSRAKADYEDAFEYFLGQKYDLNEVEDDMPEAPSHEETDAAQVYEEEIEEAEGMSGKDFTLQKIKPYLEKEGYKIGFFNDVSSIPIAKMKDDPTLAALALDSRGDVTIVLPNDDKGQKILFTSTSNGELIKDLDLENHFSLNKRFYGDGLGLYLIKK